jgi:hypothetical protein
MLQTEFEFTLPRGYVDSNGNLHKKGMMRLATAADEILPLRDPRVKANQAYLVIILLSRVITRLGELSEVNTKIIEGLFSTDLTYLQNMYRQVNENGTNMIQATCPECNKTFGVDIGLQGES